MEIGENSNLCIDSSLLKPIDLDCIRSKCVYNSCCHTDDRQLTDDDIKKIDSIKSSVSRDIANLINGGSYYNIEKHLRVTSTTKQPFPTCIFLQNEKCMLEEFDVVPLHCKTFPLLIDEYNVLRLSRSNIPCLNSESYLFSWDEIPGNDNERLKKFLSQKFSIDWVKTAKIEKFNKNPDEFKWHEGQIIKLTNEKNFLSLKRDFNTDSKLNIKLELDDGRTDEFILKNENGKDNVYDNSIPAYIILEKEISLLTSHIDKDYYTKLVMKLTQNQADYYIPPDKRFITPLSPKDKYLQTIASHINGITASEVAEQVKDLFSFDDAIYEKLLNQFNSQIPTGADEGIIYIEHKNLIDPMCYNLIKNLINKT